jgi:hypothetical protein
VLPAAACSGGEKLRGWKVSGSFSARRGRARAGGDNERGTARLPIEISSGEEGEEERDEI